MTLTPFGDRIVVQLQEEEYEGTIQVPQSAQKLYCIGTVLAVGNGQRSGVTRPMHIQVGENVLWQMDVNTGRNIAYTVDGVKTWWLHQDDVLAKLKGRAINFENIQMAGHWILVDVTKDESSPIIVPDSALETSESTRLHYIISQVGDQVKLDLKPGEEVSVAKSRLTPIKLDATFRGFIHEDFIYGKFESAPLPEAALHQVQLEGVVDPASAEPQPAAPVNS